MKAGDRYGRLIVVSFSHRKRSRLYWNFRCDCGTVKATRVDQVKCGDTQSCGCLHSEISSAICLRRATHNLAGTPIHYVWSRMLSRCRNKKDKSYPRYGGRGICVCKRWLRFANFFADMGNIPSPKHTLDRIDNSGNYEPENTRWATPTEQARNRRSTRVVSFQGKEMSLAEACEIARTPYGRVHARLVRGWTIEAALMTERYK